MTFIPRNKHMGLFMIMF